MNLKKAKILRRLAQNVFLTEKEKGNENIKDINVGQTVWIENTNRRVVEQEQEYAMVQAFDANGVALKNEDGSAQLTHSPSVNEDGTPKMRTVTLAAGTISVHPQCERGIYRSMKKTFAQQKTNVLRVFAAQLIYNKLAGVKE